MAKKSALVIGAIFLVVGILGFIPSNGIVGQGALFEADPLHNIIHLIFGVLLIGVAVKATDKSAMTLKIVGIIYIILGIIGFVQGESILGLVHVNGPDNWLHLILGIVIGALGFMGGKASSTTEEAPMMSTPPQM